MDSGVLGDVVFDLVLRGVSVILRLVYGQVISRRKGRG